MLLNGEMSADFLPSLVIKAGEDGDRQDLRTFYAQLIRSDLRIARRCLHHRTAACCMDGDEVHAEASDGGHAVTDGIRNIVELQIKKNLLSVFLQVADRITACTVVELHADLVVGDQIAKLIDQCFHFVKAVDVQCDDQSVVGGIDFFFFCHFRSPSWE